MHAKLDPVAETGLQFFGKMTASISHEIKNILAIVNENAGLLEDLALLGDQGAVIEPQRLKHISRIVRKQVGRADAIVKNMNRLAHSVDESIKITDLNEVLKLLVAVSSRFASARGVALEPEDRQDPLELRTAPLFLMALFWLCLDYAMDRAGEDKTVALATRKTEAGIQVFFKGLGGLAGASVEPFPAEIEKSLCDLVGAELEVSAENQEITVSFATDRDGE
jgi:signal transduction histidine kinase